MCEQTSDSHTYYLFAHLLRLVYELHEGRLVNVYGLAVPVVEADHEVEEVGLAEVGGRLLGELDGGHAAPGKYGKERNISLTIIRKLEKSRISEQRQNYFMYP